MRPPVPANREGGRRQRRPSGRTGHRLPGPLPSPPGCRAGGLREAGPPGELCRVPGVCRLTRRVCRSLLSDISALLGRMGHSGGTRQEPHYIDREARGGRVRPTPQLPPGLLLLRPLRLLPLLGGQFGPHLPPQHGPPPLSPPHPPHPWPPPALWGFAEGPMLGMFLWGQQASSPPSLGSPPPLAPRPPPWPRGPGWPLPPLGASPPRHAETRAQSPPWGQHCSVLPLPWGSWPAGRRWGDTGGRTLGAPHPPAPSSAPSQGSPSLLSKFRNGEGGRGLPPSLGLPRHQQGCLCVPWSSDRRGPRLPQRLPSSRS